MAFDFLFALETSIPGHSEIPPFNEGMVIQARSSGNLASRLLFPSVWLPTLGVGHAFIGHFQMTLVLQPDTVESLRDFVDARVRSDGCDHSRRFTNLWANENGVDFGELEDVLDNHGGFCDCEVVLNLPEDVSIRAAPDRSMNEDNPWMLPPNFAPKATSGFTQMLIGTDRLSGNNHHTEGELAIPAPFGLKPKRRVRKLVHYFIGLDSGMPAEVAYVAETAPMSAGDLAARVQDSPVEGLGAFTETEAAFILSRIASMKPGTSVGVSEMDKITDRGKHREMRIHRVLVRR